MQIKVKAETELADDEARTRVLRSLCCLPGKPFPKLNKTERKGGGVEKWNVVNQQLTTTKTDRPFGLPFKAPSVFSGQALPWSPDAGRV
jgi:hypothetical protein